MIRQKLMYFETTREVVIEVNHLLRLGWIVITIIPVGGSGFFVIMQEWLVEKMERTNKGQAMKDETTLYDLWYALGSLLKRKGLLDKALKIIRKNKLQG